MLYIVGLLAFALASPGASPAHHPKPSADGEKIRCKSQVETGSLASVIKVCRTEREWQTLRSGAREGAEKMMNPVNSHAPQ